MALGVSVQSPQEALTALACSDVRHIQMPFNLLDWRWREAGAIAAPAAVINAIVDALRDYEPPQPLAEPSEPEPKPFAAADSVKPGLKRYSDAVQRLLDEAASHVRQRAA